MSRVSDSLTTEYEIGQQGVADENDLAIAGIVLRSGHPMVKC